MLLALRDLLGRGLPGFLRERHLSAPPHEARARASRSIHTDDLDVAAKQDRAQSVRGIADLLLPQGRTKAHRVIRHQDAELLRGQHVSHLMESHRHQNTDGDDDDTRNRTHAH